MYPEIDPTWFLFHCPDCRRWYSARQMSDDQPVLCPRCGGLYRGGGSENEPEDPNDDLQWKI